MRSNGLFYFVLLVLVSLTSQPTGFAQDLRKIAEVADSDLFYLCKRGKNTRWLRAYKMENGKCNTIYSKEGYLQVIGSAVYYSSCEGVLHSVQKNLEEGGFKCNPVPKYSVIELD